MTLLLTVFLNNFTFINIGMSISSETLKSLIYKYEIRISMHIANLQIKPVFIIKNLYEIETQNLILRL